MSNQDKKCFIITPIGSDNSEIRRAADGVIDAVIIPTLTVMGFKEENIAVAHRMPNPGSINKQIIQRIIEDDLVITNLTTLNPNVMYELALRHAVRKPVIQICEEGTKLPFDIVEERTIFYTNDMLGAIQLKDRLALTVPEALNDEKPDNPVFRVVENISIQSSTTISDSDKILLKRLDKLETLISSKISQTQKKQVKKSIEYISIRGKRKSDFETQDLVGNIIAVAGRYTSDLGVRASNDGELDMTIQLDFLPLVRVELIIDLVRNVTSDYLDELAIVHLPF